MRLFSGHIISRVVSKALLTLVFTMTLVSCVERGEVRPSRYESDVDSLLSVADSLFASYRAVEALSLQTQAYTLADKDMDKARVQVEIARCHYFMGDIVLARAFVEDALSVYGLTDMLPDEMLKHKLSALILYAEVLQTLENTKESVRQYMRAAIVAERLNDDEAYVKCQMVTLQYEEQIGSYATAIDGYRTLLPHCERASMSGEHYKILSRLHRIFLSIGYQEEAETYLKEMKPFASSGDEVDAYVYDVAEMRQCTSEWNVDSARIANCVGRLRTDIENPMLAEYYEYNAMGLLAEYYMKQDKYDSARYFISRYCDIVSGDSNDAVYAYANLIQIQSLLYDNNLDSARVILKNGHLADICQKSVELSSRYYGIMSDYYYRLGNYRESYECIRIMTELSDSLKAETLSHNFAYRDMAHQRDTTIMSNNRKLSQKQLELDSLTFWQTVWIIIIAVAVIIAITVALNRLVDMLKEREREVYQQNQKLQREVIRHTSILQNQKVELERTNDRLNREIEYASRIQHDVLPSESRLSSPLLKGHFVYYRPCAHISGDFYWFYSIDDKLFVCCGDATGHGIPGAFVAMVCSTILNDIVSIPGITASGMLTELDRNMRNILVNNNNNHGNDSADMSLMCLDNKTGKVTLALSRHNAHIIRANGEQECVAGVKRSIGDMDEAFVARPFVEYEYTFDEGDSIYMTTDGLESQFGGPEGKKLKRKRLAEMFSAMSGLPFDSQKAYLDQYFNDWKGDCEQTDDVLVIGLCFRKK